MNKFTQKKQVFNDKVREAENLVNHFAAETEENLNLSGCKQGIEYLKEQIEAIQKDAEKIENDMQDRFKRILIQAQKVKTIPVETWKLPDFEGSEAKLEKALGGRMDYEEVLFEINELSTLKNRLLMEFKKSAPVYPKPVKPIVTQVAEKKTSVKKPAQMVPVPQAPPRKTVKTKPSSLQHIVTQPKQMPKSSSRQGGSSRAGSDQPSIIDKDQKPVKGEDLEKFEKPLKSIKNKSPDREDVKSPIQNQIPDNLRQPVKNIENFRESRNEFKDDFIPGTIPKPSSPEAFKTRTGVCKGEQTKTVTIDQIYPNLKNIETQEPPKPSLVEKTVDAVTEFVLNKLLLKEPSAGKPAEIKPSKWLGVSELSELTKLGLYFDPLTIDKVGKEVLKNEIIDLKSKKTQPKVLKVSEPSEKEESNYEDDFEEDLKIEEPVIKETKPEPSQSLFDKISPKTPPQFYDQRFEIPEKSPSLTEGVGGEGFHSLFDPRLLGRMSASSIQHYISALIESGHIPRSQGTPSFFSRDPTPKTLPLTTPQYKASETTIIEPKMPEDVKEFFTSPVGAQIFSTIKENPSLSPQQVMESWVKRQGFSVNYPPKIDFPHNNSEQQVFDADLKPEPRGARIFDLEAEEKKISEENSSIRKVFSIPVLSLPRKSHSQEECLVTDSEVSGLSQTGSIGSEVFNIENPEFFGGFMDFVRKARELEEGQVPGNSDLSEGEVRMSDSNLSSGEIPRGLVLNQLKVQRDEKPRLSGSGLLSESDFDVSDEEGDFHSSTIFKVE
jgi:hypothetical protein